MHHSVTGCSNNNRPVRRPNILRFHPWNFSRWIIPEDPSPCSHLTRCMLLGRRLVLVPIWWPLLLHVITNMLLYITQFLYKTGTVRMLQLFDGNAPFFSRHWKDLRETSLLSRHDSIFGDHPCRWKMPCSSATTSFFLCPPFTATYFCLFLSCFCSLGRDFHNLPLHLLRTRLSEVVWLMGIIVFGVYLRPYWHTAKRLLCAAGSQWTHFSCSTLKVPEMKACGNDISELLLYGVHSHNEE